MAKPQMKRLMYLAVHGDGDEAYVVASEREANAIEDDGPTLIATYKLLGKRRLIKGPQEVPTRGSKRR